MISVQNLSYVTAGKRILDDLSLDIAPGQVTALIGPNGAGKSTLLALMARLLRPDNGRITLDGLDVHRTATADIAKRLAILRQEQAPLGRLTVRDLVAFGRFPHHRGRPTAEDHLKIDTALDQLALSDLAGRFVDTLSGGQKQRVLIAMVLCQNTDVVLLDEPLNNLDPAQVRVVMDAVDHMARDLGKTVIVVLHDLNHAARHATRVIALKHGRLFAEGPAGSVLAETPLSQLYETAFDVLTHNARPMVVAR
ncbi:ATP-binding cassette domain-containing protein [Rhodobacteraceae bacterium F11138]|nr:ATP-binding cassette domain-containing protein [Rhodobacteraceae bacterium F11138]